MGHATPSRNLADGIPAIPILYMEILVLETFIAYFREERRWGVKNIGTHPVSQLMCRHSQPSQNAQKSPVMLVSGCLEVEDIPAETVMYPFNASFASSGIDSVCVLWGCELSSTERTAVFEVEDDLLEHQFFIRTICLSAEANEEMHVVEVQDKMGRSHPVPIATLRPNCLPMVSFSGFELMAPITFNLRSGQGPVFICGQHVTLDLDEDDEEPVFSNTSTPYIGQRR